MRARAVLGGCWPRSAGHRIARIPLTVVELVFLTVVLFAFHSGQAAGGQVVLAAPLTITGIWLLVAARRAR